MSEHVGFAASVDLGDIQGLLRFGYKHQTEAVFLLLRVKDARAARAWLAAADVTSSITCAQTPRTVLQIALTSEGLRALEVPADLIAGFSEEFIEGMAGDDNRSRRLGDVGANDRSRWEWGNADRVPHVALMLYALPGALAEFRRSIEQQIAPGFSLLSALDTSDLGDDEPFGFRDGISQPTLDWARQRVPRDETRLRYVDLSCLGEYLLGYPNEYGRYTPRPLLSASRDPGNELPRAEESPDLADLGRNGSYLVFRQLHQDIALFWKTIDRYARGVSADRDMLAAAMVGRTRTGEPLVALLTPPSDVAPRAAALDLNKFNYDSDPKGTRCPFGAHTRRANPRSGDFPPGTKGLISKLIRTLGFNPRAREEDQVASARFHRLLRRGREYGPGVSIEQALDAATGSTPTGLHFICLNASIQRQFEFVQGAWIMSTKFNGMRDESDPLLGNRVEDFAGNPTDRFRMPQVDSPTEVLTGLPQFVTVRGGAYFFLPGIRALRYLATH